MSTSTTAETDRDSNRRQVAAGWSGTGFHLATPGRIIILHVVLAITIRERGGLNVTRMRNGSFQALVHSYGFMGNVSTSHRRISPKLIIASRTAGVGKSVIWYDVLPCSYLTCWPVLQFEDIRALQRSGPASIAFFYCDFRDDQKRATAGYSHHCWCLADGAPPTPRFFQISM
jgi:hypothetical protein